MEATKKTLMDFVAHVETPNEYRLVQVETGPWDENFSAGLRRLQVRLSGCLDASVEGDVLKKCPELADKHRVMDVDCYDAPPDEVEGFFQRPADGILKQPAYMGMLEHDPFVTAVTLRVYFDTAGEP
jgi:hypothetical protein